LPQCCFANKQYKLTLVKQNEVLHLTIETQRYRQPQLSWTVEGKPAVAFGPGIIADAPAYARIPS
jgi:hypothetical protein